MPNYTDQNAVTRYYRPGRFPEQGKLGHSTLKADSGSGETGHEEKVYLTAANAAGFYEGDQVRVYDDAAMNGELGTVESITFDGDSSYLVLDADMTGNYTAASGGYVQRRSYFDNLTQPDVITVRQMVDDAEADFEAQTYHAWAAKTETKTYHKRDMRKVSYFPGLAINLPKRRIRDIDGEAGDKIEVFQGTDWEDWVAERSEGRNADYWLNYNDGILYLRGLYFWHVTDAVRLTYRWGETVVPNDVKEACAMMVAMRLLSMEVAVTNMPAEMGQQYPAPDERIRNWRTQIERTILRRREVVGYHR